MICVETGNRLSVCMTYEGNNQKIIGFRPWNEGMNAKIIPLPDPEGLVEVLQTCIKECREHNAKHSNGR